MDKEKIIIYRPITDVYIDGNNIQDIRLPHIEDIRLIGKNGWNFGVFGYVGKNQSEGLGYFSTYLTNWKYSVVIILNNDRPVMISPAEPEKFIKYYKKTFGKN